MDYPLKKKLAIDFEGETSNPMSNSSIVSFQGNIEDFGYLDNNFGKVHGRSQ